MMEAERTEIDFMVQIWREGGQFVAHAMPLDVASAGATPEEARRALDEALSLFIQTAADQGTLLDVMDEAGYEFVDGRWRAPHWVGIESHSLSVIR